MGPFLFKVTTVIIACLALYFIYQQLLNNHSLPTFSEFVANSTESATGTTTEQVPSNFVNGQLLTDKIAATTTQRDSKEVLAIAKLEKMKVVQLKVGTTTLNTLIADDSDTREQGLSDIRQLPKKSAMLFVFDNPGLYGFWMKDMHFPLDMVWIDDTKTVIGISPNVATTTYPNIISPPNDVLYVMELNAGYADKYKFEIGQKLNFSL